MVQHMIREYSVMCDGHTSLAILEYTYVWQTYPLVHNKPDLSLSHLRVSSGVWAALTFPHVGPTVRHPPPALRAWQVLILAPNPYPTLLEKQGCASENSSGSLVASSHLNWVPGPRLVAHADACVIRTLAVRTNERLFCKYGILIGRSAQSRRSTHAC